MSKEDPVRYTVAAGKQLEPVTLESPSLEAHEKPIILAKVVSMSTMSSSSSQAAQRFQNEKRFARQLWLDKKRD